AWAELAPGIAALAVLLIWVTQDGGFFPTAYYPGALFLLGLLVATGYAYRAALEQLPRAVLLSIGLLAAFALWNYLSIAWADNQGIAWDGANRCLLYLTVFTIFILPPWRPASGATLLGFYVLGVTAIGAVTLLEAASSGDPLEYFIAGRFSEPTSYHNANAALFTSALFPALFLASRREIAWLGRGAMLASAGALFFLALLPQSRGWLIAAPLALIFYVLVVPGRVRSLVVLAPVAVAAVLSAGPAFDVLDAVSEPGALGPALERGRDAMLLAAAALFVVGSLIALIDRRLEPSETTLRAVKRVVGGVAAAGAVAGAVVALAVIGNPVSWVGDRWDEFKGGEFEHDFSGSRLDQGLGSNRYDFWVVAFDEFQASPVVGVGSSNFAADYVRDRESDEEPRHPHNQPLAILSQTGLIGAALFLAFLCASVAALAKGRLRSDSPLARGIAALAAVVLFYWLAHSSGDWFWEFPALSAPVFAWLGLGIRLSAPLAATARAADRARAERPAIPAPPGRGRPATTVLVAAGLLAFACTASLAMPWGSAVDVEKAAESWGDDPEAAFDRLDRARTLNFLSERPDLVEGAIASQLGDQERMRVAFERALERDPRNWYARLELAALDAIEGDAKAAQAGLNEVEELNPLEPNIEFVREGVLNENPVPLTELDHSYRERVCRRLGRRTTARGCATD
ncbi:MAG: O-antigen ligase family protein, partial [Solirubrobacterales bacterium]|nr:O-antigen ligase family protein [Solirubrobacterales bacterium]